MKRKSKESKPASQTVEQARAAAERADANARVTKEKARSAKSRLKAAKKALRVIDREAKKARKEAWSIPGGHVGPVGYTTCWFWPRLRRRSLRTPTSAQLKRILWGFLRAAGFSPRGRSH